MTRATRLLIALLAAVLLTGVPAPAHAFQVGIGDQKPGMFTDPLFTSLHIRKARLIVPWDVLSQGWQRAELDRWMRAAHSAKVRPLLAFGRSRRSGRERVLPTPGKLRHQFYLLRKRYPWVSEWATWNEANHCSQATCRRPALVARYYDMMVDACGHCRIIGAEVLDQPNMVAWIRAFRAAARHEPKIWGLHNYLDANRLRTIGTRRLLAHTKGQVWFTETGGIVHRTRKRKIRGFVESPSHAALATRWVFDKLVPLSGRITRVYLYHWDRHGPKDNWDSALLSPHGKPRPAFRVLARELRLEALRLKARAAARKAAAGRSTAGAS